MKKLLALGLVVLLGSALVGCDKNNESINDIWSLSDEQVLEKYLLDSEGINTNVTIDYEYTDEEIIVYDMDVYDGYNMHLIEREVIEDYYMCLYE